MARTPDDPHRKAVQAAVRECPIPFAEVLVCDLPTGILVSTAVICVDDLVAKILIVLIAPDKTMESAPSLSLPEIPAISGRCRPVSDNSEPTRRYYLLDILVCVRRLEREDRS